MKIVSPKMCIHSIILASALAATPSFATSITYSTDFESPTFTPGPVLTQDPRFYTGQGGWGGYNAGEISTDYAHSGTQSLKTTYASGGQAPYHVLDVNNPAEFLIGYNNDWWVQAWVRVTSGGGGATMSLGNGLGGCPLINISGSGLPYYNTCTRQNNTTPSLGSNALEQWVLLQMVHTTSMDQAMDMYIVGSNVNLKVTLDQYSGPGSANATIMLLGGDAYWDDVAAGYGAAPAPVPLPASAWLMLSGLGGLGALSRKRKG